jgi:hypothetical protein
MTTIGFSNGLVSLLFVVLASFVSLVLWYRPQRPLCHDPLLPLKLKPTDVEHVLQWFWTFAAVTVVLLVVWKVVTLLLLHWS